MRKTEESLRRLKKGKSTLSIFGGTSTSKDDDRDEERIRTQMILDVEAFGQDGKSLGINIMSVESYPQLSQMVQSELVDGEGLPGLLQRDVDDDRNRIIKMAGGLHRGGPNVDYSIKYGNYQC